jgi:hypothetical protein
MSLESKEYMKKRGVKSSDDATLSSDAGPGARASGEQVFEKIHTAMIQR